VIAHIAPAEVVAQDVHQVRFRSRGATCKQQGGKQRQHAPPRARSAAAPGIDPAPARRTAYRTPGARARGGTRAGARVRVDTSLCVSILYGQMFTVQTSDDATTDAGLAKRPTCHVARQYLTDGIDPSRRPACGSVQDSCVNYWRSHQQH
jgi:hypothetical protein